MIVAAAVCPHPPLLVPALAAGAAGELDDLRQACDDAVGALVSAGADALVTVGASGMPESTGFGPWGVDVPVADVPLPLSLLAGEWLRARHGRGGERLAVPPDEDPAACAARGRRLAEDPRRLALLVLGDGSRCRGRKAPGYDDPRAAPYDEAVARGLAAADPEALLALDPAASAELGVAGRAAWQVLAGAVRAADGGWKGHLHYHEAPYGVAYLVASWEPA